jgi:hypothetical protein
MQVLQQQEGCQVAAGPGDAMKLTPPPAAAVEALGAVNGRWVGHHHTKDHWPSYGRVIQWHTWMVAQEATQDQPELGILWTWLILPRQPIRCVHAMAYRADFQASLASLFDPDADRQADYLDSMHLSPEVAWAMGAHPDPEVWYLALLPI